MDNLVNMTNKGVKGDKRRLSSAADLRLFVSALIRRIDEEQVSESKARVLIYASQVLMNIIRDNDFEQRLENIEKRLAMTSEKGGNK
jgi:hypothetical protein